MSEYLDRPARTKEQAELDFLRETLRMEAAVISSAIQLIGMNKLAGALDALNSVRSDLVKLSERKLGA